MKDFDDIIIRLIAARKQLKEANTEATKMYARYEAITENIKYYVSAIDYLERRMHRMIDGANDVGTKPTSAIR